MGNTTAATQADVTEPTAEQIADAVAQLTRYSQDQRNAYLAAYLGTRFVKIAQGARFDGDIRDAIAHIRANDMLRDAEQADQVTLGGAR